MPEEKQDVQSDSSPELEEALNAAPPAAPEQQTDTESAPPQQAESQEEEQPVAEEQAPLHEHPRFKEVVDEKNWYRSQMEKLMQNQQSQQQFQQPQAPDPYGHLTPEEQRWYRDRDTRVAEVARKEAEKYIQQNVRPIIDAGRTEMARMTAADFRRAHPDIRPNSQDELAIAEKINMGYAPDDAYWAVKGPMGVKQAETKVKQQVKRTTEAKRKANVETSGQPARTGIPSGPKKSFRDRAEDTFNTMSAEDKQALGF